MNDATSETAPDAARGAGDAQTEADRLIKALLEGLDPVQAAYVVAVLAARSASELHRLANVRAKASKGEANWGNWATLQNTARRLVLDAAPAREAAARLAGKAR